MISLQNSVSPRFSTSASSSSSGKWSNQMNLQEFAMATITTIARSQYTTLASMAEGHLRAGTKITEDFCSRQIPDHLTKGSEVELRTEVMGAAEACIHQDPPRNNSIIFLPTAPYSPSSGAQTQTSKPNSSAEITIPKLIMLLTKVLSPRPNSPTC
jgi:hypothetical protein